MPSIELRSLRARLTAAVKARIEIDTRALAAFRIALGLLVLADLALRSRNLVAFYTDFGVYPRSAFIADGNQLHLSLHAISGDAWFQALLFLIAAGLAVSLTIGYRTSTATVGSWILLISLHNRMGGVLNGGDFLLRVLLFWAIFLPLGARWAVDSVHSEQQRSSVTSVAGAALLTQIVLVYLVNASLKLAGEKWLQGQGLEYVYSLGQFTVLFGDVIGSYPTLLFVLDYLWLAMVLSAFLLVGLTGRWRTGFVFLFVAMHVGMVLTMRIDLFPLISIASLFPLLPTWFWDTLERRLAGTTVGAKLGNGPTGLAGMLPKLSISNVPGLLARSKRRLTTIVPLVFLVLLLLWNVQFASSEAHGDTDLLPDEAESVIELTRTDQYWNMFAPNPLSTDGWIVAPGQLENGTLVDAFHGGGVTWDRPPDISATYPTARWRKYLVGLWQSDTAQRDYFAEYLCRRWNTNHRSELENVSVSFMEQPTRLSGTEPINEVQLASEYC